MEKLFSTLKKLLAAGEDAVIVTVTASTGSVPRGAGAKMLVTENGRICGTVGGGAVEYEAEKLALSYRKNKQSGTYSFSLSQSQIRDIGMVCGGKVTLYFQYISSGDKLFYDFSQYALDKIKNGEAYWLITDITDAEGGQMRIYSENDGYFSMDNSPEVETRFENHPFTFESNERTYFVEPLCAIGTLYIFGGGHVAQELVPAASRVGFRCVVLDDRPEFTKPELFSGISEAKLIDFAKIGEGITITAHDYIVIMTRGHQHDSILQAQAMRTNARYIGVMGSKSKIAHVSAKMRELGFTDADLARIKTPIGLAIGAETPAEIAVSIVAELIKVRAEGAL